MICDIVDGDISAEVVATETKEMLREGRELARIHKNIVVKCPLTRDGIRATKALSQEGIRVNVTLCFSAGQALLAAKAGAYIISPFVGRLDDISQDGMQVVRDIVAIYRQHHLETLVLAASIRHPLHLIDAAKAGADIATVPYAVLKASAKHPLTDQGIERFTKDWTRFTTGASASASAPNGVNPASAKA